VASKVVYAAVTDPAGAPERSTEMMASPALATAANCAAAKAIMGETVGDVTALGAMGTGDAPKLAPETLKIATRELRLPGAAQSTGTTKVFGVSSPLDHDSVPLV
jgi:hypothetical protein